METNRKRTHIPYVSKKKRDRIYKKRLRIFTKISLVLLMMAGVGLASYKTNLFMTTSPLFIIKNIEIKGNHVIRKDVVRKLIALNKDQNIFMTDIDLLTTKVASHPWVRKAEIFISLPDKLRIVLEERRPVAVLRSKKFLPTLFQQPLSSYFFNPVHLLYQKWALKVLNLS